MPFKLEQNDIELDLDNLSDNDPLMEFDHSSIPDSYKRDMALHNIDTNQAGIKECKEYLKQGLISEREYYKYSGDDAYNYVDESDY